MVQTPCFLNFVEQYNPAAELLAADLIAFPSLRQQADFFNAGRAHIVDGVFNRLVLRARIRADINGLVSLVFKLIPHQAAKLRRIDLVLSEVPAPSRVTATTIASSLSASGMLVGFSTWAKVMATLFCSMGVMTMKMIEKHQHHIHHGSDVIWMVVHLSTFQDSLLLASIDTALSEHRRGDRKVLSLRQ